MTKNDYMGSQVHVRAIALFLIALVISFPFTLAAQIDGVSLTGTIGAGAVVKPGDTVSASVNVTAAQGETLEAVSLATRLRLGADTQFTSCAGTLIDGLFTCSASFVLNPTIRSKYISPVEVLLFSDATQFIELSRDANAIIIDGESPTISLSGLEQFGTQARIAFNLADTALSPNSPASCSGIKSLEFYWLNGTTQTPIPYSVGEVTGCSYANTTQFSVPASGLRQVCGKVTDRAGFSSQSCMSYTFDISQPAISAIDLETSKGPTRYITGNGTQMYVVFNTSLNTNRNAINVTVEDDRVSPVTCSGARCTAGPFAISLAKTYDISISAATSFGIVASATQSVAINVDNTSPVFTSLKSNLTFGNKIYFRPGLSLTAHFAEEATGLADNNSQLSIAGTSIGKPTRCVKVNPGWDCVWERVSYTSTVQGNLSVIASATDLLGNVGANGNATIIYDTQAPVVTNVNITAIGSGGASSIASSGSTIKVSFNFSDSSTPVTVRPDFSVFEPPSNLSTVTCGSVSCDVTSRPIGPGPYNAPASVFISDLLGNNVTITTASVEVLHTSNETNPTYFRHTLSLTPAALEKTTFPYINQKGYAVINVQGVGPAKVLKLDFKQCRNIPVVTLAPNGSVVTSSFSTTSASVSDTRWLQSTPQVTVVNSSQIFVAFTFKTGNLNQSNIQFLCDFDVAGRLGDTFIPKETETVLVNFSTYSLSVGELGANYDKKLNDQIKKAQNHIGAKLETFEKLFDIAKKICNLWKFWIFATTAWKAASAAVKTTAGGIAATIIALPAALGIDFTGSLNCGAAETAEAIGDTVFKVAFSGFCSFISCQVGITDVVSAAKAGTVGEATRAVTGAKSVASSLASRAAGSIASDMGASSSSSAVASNWANSVVSSINPEDTLAGAMINLCIPGIIRALRRAQQIECQYAVCLRDEVPKGVSIEACDQSYEYSSCAYKTANFFILFAIWDAFINKIKSLISDPFAVAGLAGAAICAAACYWPLSGIPHAACTIPRSIGKIGALVGMIMGIKNDWTQDNYQAQNYCAQLN